MADQRTNGELLDAWRAGDHDAAETLYARFHRRLVGLIRSRLARRLARRIDPEDVVLSAYRSFFLSVRRGGVTEAAEDLWPLLTTFALRKLARQARRHSAARRSCHRESWDQDPAAIAEAPDQTAEQAAILSEEFQSLLDRLEPVEREVVMRTLNGEDRSVIAGSLGVHERTVRRILERIQRKVVRDAESISNSKSPRPSIAREPASPRPRRGTVAYSQYLLQQYLGRGAFSKVYRAICRTTGDQVAIKFLRRKCWHEPRAIEALIREFEILRTLPHPGILATKDWGTTPQGGVFLVTELATGGDLSAWSSTQHPSPRECARVVQEVACAIAFAHSQGVLHCDLKPSNVLLRENGQILLCDFGMARYATDTEAIPHGGTAGFLSPEHIDRAFGPLSERTDVYGLGALLYTLLSGRPPVTGHSVSEVLKRVLTDAAIPPLCATLPEIPPELEAITLRCLAREPGARYSTARDVANALAACSSTNSSAGGC